jgi:hypothetical protein
MDYQEIIQDIFLSASLAIGATNAWLLMRQAKIISEMTEKHNSVARMAGKTDRDIRAYFEALRQIAEEYQQKQKSGEGDNT